MLDEAPMIARGEGEDDDVVAARSRRRFLTQVAGGAAVFALSAMGAVAPRRADAKDDEGGDDNSGSGSGGGDEQPGHGGDDDAKGDDADQDDDGSSHGGDDDDDHDDDDDIRRVGTPVAGAIEVLIADDDADGFSLGTLTVDLGASVTFVNVDHHRHTATSASFDTGVIEPGAAATVTLDEPGTLFYACLIHPEMIGTIVVRNADGTARAATPRATPRGNRGG